MGSRDAPPPTPRFNRRQLASMTAAGALAGGIWTVGLASILRSAEPDLTILGSDDWQVMLLETGTDRILLLIGTFDDSPNDAIRQLRSTLRQHVDLIIATGSAIAMTDRSGVLERAALIQLDADPAQPDSLRVRALRQRLVVEFQDVTIDLQRIPDHEWSSLEQRPASWVIHLRISELEVVIGPDLEQAARQASPTAAMLVAPGGDVGSALALAPGVSIVANGYGLEVPATLPGTSGGYLVRTFPTDSSRLRFTENRISLPSWAQPLSDLTS